VPGLELEEDVVVVGKHREKVALCGAALYAESDAAEPVFPS
jgi:hypothetical protein